MTQNANTPKVSIIIPIYNSAKFLKKCIKSILAQSLKDIEIICVDDGSSDNSKEILDQFSKKDLRIKVITQENKGVSAARNAGIKAAGGEFLGFVDADDWVDKKYFEKLYLAAIQNGCNSACAGFKRVKKFSSSVKKKFKKEEVFEGIEQIARAVDIPSQNYVWNKIFNRKIWLESGIAFPEGRYYEDMAILLKILHKMERLVSVPGVYYNYRKNQNSTVSKRTRPEFMANAGVEKYKKDFAWAQNELYSYAKSINLPLEKRKDDKKEYVKLFNITILKIYYSKNTVKYRLFGFIPFIVKIRV